MIADARRRIFRIDTDDFLAMEADDKLMLSDAIVDMESELTITLNDAEVFSGVPGTSWSTLVRTALTNDPGRTFTARIPLD